jgi:hypothetical protein
MEWSMRAWLVVLSGICLLVLAGCWQSTSSGEAVVGTTSPQVLVAPPGKARNSRDGGSNTAQGKSARKDKKAVGAQSDVADDKGKGYSFPDDPGGQELAVKLPPRFRANTVEFPAAGKVARKVPAVVVNPSLLAPLTRMELPRLPQGATTSSLQPGAVPEDAPLADHTAMPELPASPALATGVPLRIDEEGMDGTIAVPPVIQPAAIAAATVDPTRDSSWKAALAGPLPPRDAAAPFVRRNLPDPFEHRRTGELRPTPAESADPVVGSPEVPQK